MDFFRSHGEGSLGPEKMLKRKRVESSSEAWKRMHKSFYSFKDLNDDLIAHIFSYLPCRVTAYEKAKSYWLISPRINVTLRFLVTDLESLQQLSDCIRNDGNSSFLNLHLIGCDNVKNSLEIVLRLLKSVSLLGLEYDGKNAKNMHKLLESMNNNQNLGTLKVNSTCIRFNAEEKVNLEQISLKGLNMDQLRILPVSGLGKSLAQNRSLTRLSLANGSPTKGEFEDLTNSLCVNSTLKYLGLRNHFADLGTEACEMVGRIIMTNRSLVELDLSENKMNDEGANLICAGLRKNDCLKKLFLDENNIGPLSCVALADSLRSNSALTQLSLATNIIGCVGSKALATVLKENRTLTEVDLTSNRIGDEGAIELAKSLVRNSSLRTLTLWKNRITCDGAKYLAAALLHNKRLSTLTLYGNNISDNGTIILAKSLKVQTCLKELWLAGNNIGHGVHALSNVLASNNTVEVLVLHSNRLLADGAESIADMLAVNNTIRKLYIGFNNIRSEGAGYIAEALKKNTGLIELNIGANSFGAEGAMSISDALKENNTLSILNMWDNNIGDEGAICIGEALSDNTSLEDLYLNNNEIGDTGTEAIADGLLMNESLTRLNFAGNETDGAFSELASALAGNHTLKVLDCSCMPIGVEGAAAIAKGLRDNTGLHYLLLRSCQIDEEGCQYLAENLVYNETLDVLDLSISSPYEEFASEISPDIASRFAKLKTCFVRHELNYPHTLDFNPDQSGFCEM